MRILNYPDPPSPFLHSLPPHILPWTLTLIKHTLCWWQRGFARVPVDMGMTGIRDEPVARRYPLLYERHLRSSTGRISWYTYMSHNMATRWVLFMQRLYYRYCVFVSSPSSRLTIEYLSVTRLLARFTGNGARQQENALSARQ